MLRSGAARRTDLAGDFDTVEGTAVTATWRRAVGVERLGFIVIAARRGMICKTCGGMGWQS